jgi:hypothetical protein
MYDNTMEQNRPLLITSEEIVKLPILIVDRDGFIGSALAKILRDQFLVVVVTASKLEKHENIIHVPYTKKIPMIPDNAYSHMFIIYNGETELLDMLSAFEVKAEAVNARFLFITSLLYSNPKVFKEVRNERYKFLQSIIYGETFDNNISEANEINFFIHQVRVYGRIELPGEGLGRLYPILFDDVLTSIVSLAFAVEKPKETIYLFPHHPNDEITVARIIQKIDPLIKMDFTKRKSNARIYYIPPGGLYFYRNYNLEEKIHKIDFSRINRRSKLPQKKIKLLAPKAPSKQSQLNFIWVILAAIFIAPIVASLLCALFGAGVLQLSIRQVETGNLQTAVASASVAQTSFSVSENLGPSLLLAQLIIPKQKQQFIDMVQTGQTVAQTEISFVQAIQTLENIYKQKSLDPKDDFLSAITTLKNNLLTLQKLEAENNLPQPVLKKLHKYDSVINLVEETIDTWPSLLGFDRGKTYLILFQNNMELRPGGGFIGSYGLLPISNGTPGKLDIHDVYEADGQLTQQVQPPYGLQRYLGVSHWFLRDSNFDPDFVTDAQQAAFFLQKETGKKVDGVIGIDITFLKNLLTVFGPVYVPDYKVTVTPDNFYVLTETNSEKNFFPGSTQKKDFLSSMTNAVVDKMTSGGKLPYEKIVQMLLSSIQQKDLLFAFSDKNVQNVFMVNNMSSSLWDGRSYQSNTAFDYFGVIDANLGVNKTNYYVKRSITQSTSLVDLGELQTTADVVYTNTSTQTSPFGGEYRDYVRFLLPGNADLVSIAFDKKTSQLSPAVTDPSIFTVAGFTPPPGLEVDQTEEEGKSVIGFFFLVPIGATRTVSITYRSPSGIDPNAVAFTYNLRVFKEPGTANDPYQFSLTYPSGVAVLSSSDGFTNVGGKLIYEGQLSQDGYITANFSKK